MLRPVDKLFWHSELVSPSVYNPRTLHVDWLLVQSSRVWRLCLLAFSKSKIRVVVTFDPKIALLTKCVP